MGIEMSAAWPTKGFDSLESEVRVDELPLSGELPAWLDGLAAAHRARPSSRSASGR